MRKTITMIIAAVILVCAISPMAYAYSGDCSAATAILYQPDTGEVLFERSADQQMLIASTTKIMTALVALENCDPDEMVEIIPEYTGVLGSSMYLMPGERFTIKELLYGLLMASGNDAAHAIACHVAGSDAEFAELMNEKAEELGCTNSHYANPHGLDTEGHYSSARDLALIMETCMQNETFAEIIGTKTLYMAGRTFTNHNKLLWTYDGVLGGKTGYTTGAGRTLVTCCERDGMRLICVTITDGNDWVDHVAMYDWAYSAYQLVSIPTEYSVPVISGEAESVTITAEPTFALVAKDAEYETVVELPKFTYAGVTADTVAGSCRIICGDEVIAEAELVYAESVAEDESIALTKWEKLKWSWSNMSLG